uniref:Fibronectin type-III domain-containing protein n=1 Tax=Leptobrachium leishanense TaxID=445787 RepID=A0A8C5LX58_9ANUR
MYSCNAMVQSWMMTPKTNKATMIMSFAIIQMYFSLSDNQINFSLKPPDVSVAEVGVNSVTLSFSTEEDEEMTCYILSYQYLDSIKCPKQEWIQTNYETIQLSLYSGFQANVSVASCDLHNPTQRSNWTQFTYKAPEVYICNVSCYIYNVTSLNCTWDLKRGTPNHIQYSFSLRQKSSFLPCQHYLRNAQNKNIGCHMKDIFAYIDRTNMKSKMTIQFSYHDVRLFKIFKFHRIEILNPPVNISLSSKNKILKLQWNPPPSVQGNLGSHCFEYQIKLLETKNNDLFRVDNTTLTEYTFLDLDKDRKYSVQIRGRKKFCATSKFWGEWSEPIFIGKDNDYNTTWRILAIIIICTTLLTVAVLYLIKRNRKIFDTAIPGPSRKLDYWISSTEINFKKSVRDLPSESVTITDIEIISTNDCLESQPITM